MWKLYKENPLHLHKVNYLRMVIKREPNFFYDKFIEQVERNIINDQTNL